MADIIFIKFGGSLITDKNEAHTPRPEIIQRLAEEVQAARNSNPGLRLVIGHGSGSYGHTPARKYNTRGGVATAGEWLGFAEVWREARALNQIMVEALCAAGIPVIAFPPSACFVSAKGHSLGWDPRPMRAALEAGLVPLVNGDTVFDMEMGGTIFSTEDVFRVIAPVLRPLHVLMVGREPGVWADYPACTRLLEHITSLDLNALGEELGGSASVDVTGGMRNKVESMLRLSQAVPGLEGWILTGLRPGLVQQALGGHPSGTRITYA